MAKIKGWTRRKVEDDIIYESDALRNNKPGFKTRITISPFYPDPKLFGSMMDGWQVMIIQYDRDNDIIHEVAIPKYHALEIARQYMRSHPNG